MPGKDIDQNAFKCQCVHVLMDKSTYLPFVFVTVWLRNPLSPDMKIHILLTVLHAFRMELIMRICLNIKTSHPW